MSMLAILGLAVVVLTIVGLVAAIRIVPQSETYVVERFGRYLRTLTPGPNLIVPGIDSISYRVSTIETPLDQITIEAITRDNTTIVVTASTFFRVVDPRLSVYRIADVQGAIRTLVTGVVRSLVGSTDLDEVQTNRDQVSKELKTQLELAAHEWGVEITRSEIIDVTVDEATRRAMLAQITAERERRATVTRAEGEKRAAELRADAELYTAQKTAEARRIAAEAEAYATEVVAKALAENGTAAAGFEIAKSQIRALTDMGKSPASKVVLVPSDMSAAFGALTGFAGILGGLTTASDTSGPAPAAKSPFERR